MIRKTLLAAALGLVLHAHGANRHVSPHGADAGDCLAAPCRSITYAMAQALPGNPGDVILVAPGKYADVHGEQFPIAVKSGVRVIATGSAYDTLIEAHGAGSTNYSHTNGIFVVNGNASLHTAIEGLTIAGGVKRGAAGTPAAGGAIAIGPGSGHVGIRHNIFLRNLAIGHDATSAASPEGGEAAGGAIGFTVSTTHPTVNIYSNAFSANQAIGGKGLQSNPAATTAYGGRAVGGALRAYANVSIYNNTFYANRATGGKGGGVSGGGSGGGGALFASEVSIANNIFFYNQAYGGAGTGELAVSFSGAAYVANTSGMYRNLFHTNFVDGAFSNSDTHGTDPLLQHPRFVGAFLRIGDDSPAKGAGTSSKGPGEDLDRNFRPATPSLGAYEPAARPFDVDRDGRADILWRHRAAGLVHRMSMNGTAIVSSGAVHNEPDTNWKVVGSGDFDGDGAIDLLYRHAIDGRVVVLHLDRSGKVEDGALVHVEPSPAWQVVGTPDINGDNRADILWRNSSNGTVYAMLMGPAGIKAQGVVHVEPDLAWRIVGVGSLDAKKRNQIVWHHAASGEVYVMSVQSVGAGFERSGQVAYREPDVAWQIVGVADIDGDGRSDLVWRHAASGQVWGTLMDGAGVLVAGAIHAEPNPAWVIAGFGDYDASGSDDLLWQNTSTGEVYMMLMQGLQVGSAGPVHVEPDTQWRILGEAEYAK